MKKLFSILVLATIMLAVCTTDETQDLAVEIPGRITVVFEEDSRIQLNEELKTVWTKGDAVSVFYKSDSNDRYDYQGETGERLGVLLRTAQGTATVNNDKVVVVYPYNENYAISHATSSIDVTIPAVQYYTSGSYGVGANLMIASGDDSNFTLKNICGWIQLQFTGSEKLTKITLRGNNNEQIAGRATANYEEYSLALITANEGSDTDDEVGGTLVTEEEYVREITLDLGEGVQLTETPTDFYIVLAPQTFTKGITVTATADSGTCMTQTTDKEITISRNTIQPMTAVNYQLVLEVSNDATLYAPAEGGNVTLTFLSNVECEVVIPEEAQEWISLAPTTRAMTERNITLQLTANEGYYRSAEVKVQSTDGKLAVAYTIEQDGELGVEIDPTQIPDNEIWYTTSNGEIVLGVSDNAFDQQIISNTYSNGKGIIKLSGELKVVKRSAFDNPFNLKYLILPNSVETIENQSFVGGELDSLYIPKNLKQFTGEAFAGAKVNRFVGDSRVQNDGRFFVENDTLKIVSTIKEKELIIPGTIKVIGAHALWMNNPNVIKVEVQEGVEVIDAYAFSGCKSLEYVYLPNSIELQNSVFDYCDNIRQFYGPAEYVSSDGRTTYRYVPLIDNGLVIKGMKFISNIAKAGLTEYTVEDDIDGIDPESFCRAYDLKRLTINSTSIYISGDTFDECYNLEQIIGAGATPDGKGYVGSGSFGMECSLINAKLLVFAGKGITEYEVGDYCREIGSGVFACQKDLKTVKLDDNIIRLGDTAFWGCQQLEEVTLPANLQYIGDLIFMACPNLKTVYLRSLVPPTFENYSDSNTYDIFDINNNLGNLKINVPKQSLQVYLDSPDWAPYRNYIQPYEYTDLPIRDYYISTDYSSDGNVTVLQKATKGDGVDVVLMGDGYSDRQIADGTYASVMQSAYEKFFSVEPYKSHKELFNVYYVTAVSATEGYEYGNTALDGYFGNGTLVGGDDSAAMNYALNAIEESRLDNANIVVMMNSENYAGTCYMYYPSGVNDYGSGVSVSYFPVGTEPAQLEQLLHHEACGHGFAKLSDEYAYEYMGAVPADYVSQTQTQQRDWGWWKNVDFTSDPAAVLWAKFIADERYKYDGLGAFEGGLTYWSGVWRPTEDSIMRYNVGGFNAPSREAIYYRIHKLAYGDSWTYDYEKFVEWDSINRKSSAAQAASLPMVFKQYEPTAPPVVVGKSWREALGR